MQTIPINKLVYLLRSQIIPQAAFDAHSSFFVARDKARSLELPENVTISRRKLLGRREVVKDRRKFGNLRHFIAEWPEDNLQEITSSKIVCIVSGIADYLLGDYCAHCPPGTFFLVPPGVPHQCKAPNLQGERRHNGSCVLLHAYAHKYGVHFWYSRSVNERHINESEDNYLIPSLTAAQTLHSLADEAREKRPHLETVASGLITALFAIIAREIEAGNYTHTGATKNLSIPSQRGSFSEEVHQYMEANCHRQLRLAGVAADLFMSRSQFARRIRQEMGTTFVKLLTRYRMERACNILCETSLTVNAIATTLGFRSSTHFQSIFRSSLGCTPTEYRRKNTLPKK